MHGREHAVDNLGGRAVVVVAQRGEEMIGTEHLAGWRSPFENPVGDQQHDVAGGQLERVTQQILRVGQHRQRQTAAAQHLFHVTRVVEHVRRRVPRAHVAYLARGRVQPQEEERDEPCAIGLAEQNRVRVEQDLFDVIVIFRKRSQVGAGSRHNECRTDIVPAHVADHDAHGSIGQLEEVEVISSGEFRRQDFAGDVEARHLRRTMRQDELLNALRRDQLCFPLAQRLLVLFPLRDIQVRTDHPVEFSTRIADGGTRARIQR